MNIQEMILKCRSYRRFDASYDIYKNELLQLVNIGRLTPSARNMQPLKYKIVYTKKECDIVFPKLGWAGYLKDWAGPEESERPTAYIIVMKDTELADDIFCDDGLALQAMLFGAVEIGLGGCIIGSINKEALSQELAIDKRYEIRYVLALGKPVEQVVIEKVEDNNIRYWRSEDGIHHVPKRSIDEVLI